MILNSLPSCEVSYVANLQDPKLNERYLHCDAGASAPRNVKTKSGLGKVKGDGALAGLFIYI